MFRKEKWFTWLMGRTRGERKPPSGLREQCGQDRKNRGTGLRTKWTHVLQGLRSHI